MKVKVVSVTTLSGENRDQPDTIYQDMTGMTVWIDDIKKGYPLNFKYSETRCGRTSTVQKYTYNRRTRIYTVQTKRTIYLFQKLDDVDVDSKSQHALFTWTKRSIKHDAQKEKSKETAFKAASTNIELNQLKPLQDGNDVQHNAIDVENLCLTYKTIVKRSIKSVLLTSSGRTNTIEALKGVSFSVPKGEILGIIGPNGSGKSTLLRTLTGLIHADSGCVNLHGNTISLLSLGTGFLGDISGRDNIILSGLLMGFSKKEILEKYDRIVAFSELGDAIERPVRTYSSGMFSKLAFSISIMLETDILLIDEVLSVGDLRFKKKSYEALKKLIENKQRTVLIVSHNLNEINKLCDRVMWMEYGVVREIGEPKTVLANYHKSLAQAPENLIWLPAPMLHVESGHDAIHLSWNKVANAEDYRLYRKENIAGSQWSHIADGYEGLEFYDVPPSKEMCYLYTIRARGSNNQGNVWSGYNPGIPAQLK